MLASLSALVRMPDIVDDDDVDIVVDDVDDDDVDIVVVDDDEEEKDESFVSFPLLPFGESRLEISFARISIALM
jgi:hypothetical protein